MLCDHIDFAALRVGELPKNWIASVMQSVLPPNAYIENESKEAMQQCVSEFITFITAEVVDTCRKEKRVTIHAEDIIKALDDLGFENYVPILDMYKNRYQEPHGDADDGMPPPPPPPPAPLNMPVSSPIVREGHHQYTAVGMPPQPPPPAPFYYMHASRTTVHDEHHDNVMGIPVQGPSSFSMPVSHPTVHDDGTDSFVESSVIRDSDGPR